MYNARHVTLQYTYSNSVNVGPRFVCLGQGIIMFFIRDLPVTLILLPQQFPLAISQQKELTTQRVVLFSNSLTEGLSFVPPICRWQPEQLFYWVVAQLTTMEYLLQTGIE